MTPTLTLTTRWDPRAEPPAYRLVLRNEGSLLLTALTLGFSGPALGCGPDTRLEGATLVSQLSNHFLVAPPAGFVLEPQESWTITIHGMPHPLRHWTDGAVGAYVVLPGTGPVPVSINREADAAVPALKGAERFATPERPESTLSVIPWPASVATDGMRETPKGLDLQRGESAANDAAAVFASIVADLFPDEGLVRSASDGGLPVAFSRNGLGPEAYEVAFDAAGATVSASAKTGFLYGLITLAQVVRGARRHPGTLIVPATGRITDEPEFGWRGSHFDSVRHFFPVGEVARFLKIMAWNKMNRFHWHLSDDEGWRVEIDALPELTRTGAWRGHDMALPPLLGSGPNAEGGYYAKAEIRALVSLARDLGIEIVPEIDVPGHCFAVLQSLPALRDPDEGGEYRSIQGFPNNCLNPAHEPVYRFMETAIDEILELFPAGVFHLGADEVPLAAWSGSPMALGLLGQLAGDNASERHRARAHAASGEEEADAIAGSDAAVLQARFIDRVHQYLKSRGAITGGWEEAAHGGVLDKSKSYLVGWRNVEVSATLAGEGYDIVASPAQRYYLDMALSTDWSEPGAGWAGASSPEETYRFDPRDGWSKAQLEHLLGVQSCIWSERLADPAVFDRLVFPRLSAVAETGWTKPGRKSWDRFSAFCGLMPLLYGHWSTDG